MISLNIYFRIVRLKSCNKNLLRIYDILKEKERNDEDLIYSLDVRTSLRNEIDKELKSLLEELKSNKNSILCSLFEVCDKGVKIEFSILDAMRQYSLRTCFDCELQNVNQYYNALYALRSHRNLTDILLRQKSNIENYLIKEM